jgi:hypothetical protein
MEVQHVHLSGNKNEIYGTEYFTCRPAGATKQTITSYLKPLYKKKRP